MDEQALRNEIDAARGSRFPTTELEYKKITLRDTYYKTINELKVLAVNVPEEKKEELIQRIISAAAGMENLETELLAAEPTWVRPEGALISLDEGSLFWDGENSIAKLTVGEGNFLNNLTLNGSPVLSSLEGAWPVDSIFISINPTNPGITLGFGTWNQIAAGKMLIGVDTADADFSSAEQTGGSKNHTLTEAEMPTHNHIQNPHTHNLMGGSMDSNKFPFTGPDASTANTNTFQGGIASTIAVNQPAGGGQPHNNMPPYFAVYIFKREA